MKAVPCRMPPQRLTTVTPCPCRQRTTANLTARDKQVLQRFAGFWPVHRLQLPRSESGRNSKLAPVAGLQRTLMHLEVAISNRTDDLKWMQGAHSACMPHTLQPACSPAGSVKSHGIFWNHACMHRLCRRDKTS